MILSARDPHEFQLTRPWRKSSSFTGRVAVRPSAEGRTSLDLLPFNVRKEKVALKRPSRKHPPATPSRQERTETHHHRQHIPHQEHNALRRSGSRSLSIPCLRREVRRRRGGPDMFAHRLSRAWAKCQGPNLKGVVGYKDIECLLAPLNCPRE